MESQMPKLCRHIKEDHWVTAEFCMVENQSVKEIVAKYGDWLYVIKRSNSDTKEARRLVYKKGVEIEQSFTLLPIH